VNQIWINLLVVLFFVLLGGFFAAAELALVSLRESQVQRLAEGSKRGRRLATLTADPNRFLASVQVGVTLAGFHARVLPDWILGHADAPDLAPFSAGRFDVSTAE